MIVPFPVELLAVSVQLAVLNALLVLQYVRASHPLHAVHLRVHPPLPRRQCVMYSFTTSQ